MSDVADTLGGEEAPQAELFDAMARLKLDLNDNDNGHRLASVLKDEAIHVVGRGWGVWDGRRYNFEGGAARMLALASCLQRIHEEEAAALARAPVPKWEIDARVAQTGEDREVAEKKIRAAKRGARMKYARSCGNVGRIRAALEMATAAFLVEMRALDADRSVLQVENGTLDLAAIAAIPEAEEPEEKLARWRGALGPHRREGYPTRLAGARFDPEARCPEWERFLRLAMPAEADRRYLQRCMGSLLGGRQQELFFVFLGPGGNGKSTVVSAVRRVMGDYAQPCRIEMFLEHRNAGGNGPTPEEAVLPGARAYIAQEPREGATLDAGKIKGLTGGDIRQANPKNKDLFNYEPVGVPLLQMNRMARVNDPSEGFWRRCFPVLFTVALAELPPGERRSEAQMKAAIEAELPGILNWMLEGWAEFRAIGPAPPASVGDLRASLRMLADPVGSFLAEATTRQDGVRVRTSDLYRAFSAWCEGQGDRPVSAKAFTAAMLALDYRRTKASEWYWLGLDLNAEGMIWREKWRDG